MTRDPFTEVMGSRRGSARPDGPDAHWWRWTPGYHKQLSDWLDHVVASGYVQLEVTADQHSLQFTVRASRPSGHAGQALLEIDPAAELWLEDHWPDEFITGRGETWLRGRLRR